MTEGIGHNSVARDDLRAIVERIESLEETKADVASDIKDVYQEAAGKGFDKKALRTIIRIRKDKDAWKASQDLVDVYCSALGLLD